MMAYIFFFVGAAAVAFFLTPFAIWVAAKAGALDEPDARKVHARPTPRLGGLAIFGSVMLCLGLALGLLPGAWETGPWPSVLVGALMVYLLGFTDDMNRLSPKAKFAVQAVAALVAVSGGVVIYAVDLPGVGAVDLGFWSYPLTLFWLVGVTNAFNLIDGLDGLAGGLALIASFSLFILAAGVDPGAGLVAVIVAGALVGFLRYNFHPAQVFMGDSGSLFVGYLVACMSVQSMGAGGSLGFIAPVLAVAVPVLDTLTAMGRRYLGAIVKQRGRRLRALREFGVMFQPDRGHIHHCLLDRGLTQWQVVTILYGMAATVAFAGLYAHHHSPSAVLVVAALALFLFFGVRLVAGRATVPGA
jgi:UDP-GlcNAc:undecaprenyl-phosphate/decaprenyl-phosphate GlcNAc-1-phosphate transferase